MKTFLKKYYYYILIFLFFLIILSLCPISGDDWGNYLVGIKGINNSINNAIELYSTWEGRFISRILINLLTPNKIIWNILNSITIVSIIYFIFEILKPKNRTITIFLITNIFLFMNPYIFSQTITWIAGNITYLFVISLFLFYIKHIKEEKYKTCSNISIIFISILNFISTLFVEHIGGVLVLFNLFILIYNYAKDKKINKVLLLYFTSSVIGISIMLFSPGSSYRSTIENIEFNSLSLLDKVKYNLLNFVNYSFIYNPYLLILMSITSFILIKNNIKNFISKSFCFLYLSIIPMFIMIFYLLELLEIMSININSLILIIYFLSYILLFLFIIIIKYKKKNKNDIIFFYILGIFSNSIMLLSPTWGYRTTLATYIFISISLIIIIDTYIKESKIIKNLLLLSIIMAISFYIILYSNVYIAQKDLEQSIKSQLNSNNDIIEIVRFPSFVNCNINPEGEYHLEKFKNYYNIPEEKEVKLVNKYWKYKMFYLK